MQDMKRFENSKFALCVPSRTVDNLQIQYKINFNSIWDIPRIRQKVSFQFSKKNILMIYETKSQRYTILHSSFHHFFSFVGFHCRYFFGCMKVDARKSDTEFWHFINHLKRIFNGKYQIYKYHNMLILETRDFQFQEFLDLNIFAHSNTYIWLEIKFVQATPLSEEWT